MAVDLVAEHIKSLEGLRERWLEAAIKAEASGDQAKAEHCLEVAIAKDEEVRALQHV